MSLAGRGSARGAGIPLLLVLSLVFILGFIGFHQLFFASHVIAEGARGAWGDVALGLAESAVEELMFRVKSDVGDPSRPLFRQLRMAVEPPATGGFLVTDSERVDVTPSLIREAGVPGLEIELTSVRVDYQMPFELLPEERFGLLRYRARVTAQPPGGAKIVRDLEVGQGFKVVLATVPRPFDQAAVYVGDVWSATDLSEANRLRERCLRTVGEQLELLAKAAALAPPALAGRYSEARSAIPSSPDTLAALVPKFTEAKPALLIGLGADGQEFPLEGLDCARRVAADITLADPLAEAARAAFRTVEGQPTAASSHEALLNALAASLEAWQKPLNRLWAYGEGYRIVGVDEPDYQDIAGCHSRLELDHWRRLASFALADGPGGTAQRQFEALSKRLGVMNGVVLVERPGAPFVLSGDVRGKLVLVVLGGAVVLDGVNSGERPSDLLTVVALGARVELRGECRASLVLATAPAAEVSGPPDSVLTMAGGASLRGGFVATRLGDGAALNGSVFRAEKAFSGLVAGTGRAPGLIDRYAVLVSPLTVFRKVLQQ